MMISMLLEDMLTELGYEVVGPAARLEQALTTARNAAIEGAVLDVNLNGHYSYPVADLLQQRGIPFVFATGYGADLLGDRYPQAPRIQKPFQQAELARALARALEAGPPK